MPELTTGKVIEILGGHAALAKMTGRTYSASCNWLMTGRFPPTLFLLMSRALLEKGIVADPRLWSMEDRPKEVA